MHGSFASAVRPSETVSIERLLDSGLTPWRRIILSARDNIWSLVDACDYDWLSRNTWNVSWGSRTPWQLYAKRNVGPDRATLRQHREIKIVRDPRSERFMRTHHVDHGNGQTLDNRDDNLAWCTHKQNMKNRRPRSAIPSLEQIVLELMRVHDIPFPQEVPF
ncbi:HNH endonuclease [Bradyrhizobium elkanii]